MDTIDSSSNDFVPVAELIRAQARRTPRAIAVQCGERRYTYARLDREIDALAARLATAGVGAGQVIGVQLERGVDLVVALIAVMRAGAAYLPLDPQHPQARRDQLIADAGVTLLVTRAAVYENSESGVPALFVGDGDGGRPGPSGWRPRASVPTGSRTSSTPPGPPAGPRASLATHGSLTRMARSVAPRLGLGPGAVLSRSPRSPSTCRCSS